MDTTCDWILGHRVQLEQPRMGFRVAIDTVLLAAAVQAQTGQSALDMGCGVGGAMLALAIRVPAIKILGIEIQEDLVNLCRRNIERNGKTGFLHVAQADICSLAKSNQKNNAPPLPLRKEEKMGTIDSPVPASFDCVFMNPPYHEADKHDLSPHKSKIRANAEQKGELAQWLTFAATALKQKGWLTLIHRADRLENILAQAAVANLGGGEILHICPRENKPPSRVILRLQKDCALKPKDERKLVLHNNEGGYTTEAEAILRHAESLR